VSLTIVFDTKKIFLKAQTAFGAPETIFTAIGSIIFVIERIVFFIETIICGTKTIFSEAEAIFIASETHFFIREKRIAGETPTIFVKYQTNHLARIIHEASTAAADPGMSTALRFFGLLDVLLSTPAVCAKYWQIEIGRFVVSINELRQLQWTWTGDSEFTLDRRLFRQSWIYLQLVSQWSVVERFVSNIATCELYCR
jgi:hypothetical protein